MHSGRGAGDKQLYCVGTTVLTEAVVVAGTRMRTEWQNKTGTDTRGFVYLLDKNQGSQRSCTPIEETYLSMFSSAVPVQLVPSISQAFHDGMARVAARMSAMTSALSAPYVDLMMPSS